MPRLTSKHGCPGQDAVLSKNTDDRAETFELECVCNSNASANRTYILHTSKYDHSIPKFKYDISLGKNKDIVKKPLTWFSQQFKTDKKKVAWQNNT